MKGKIRIGLIGCGKISDQYFVGCRRYDVLELAACADLDVARARAKAAEHAVPRACTVAELLADPSIDLVVNLTIPQAHAAVNEQALRAGMHVYVEKPFALDPAEGVRVLALAASRGLLVGCAPDTFLGGGLQTARQLLDDGAIGRPVSAMAFWLSRGHESWHPAPEFYYQAGGGPMFDMGPYYLTALVALFGPVKRVCGFARRIFPERTITSQPRAGAKIPVEVSTHYLGTLDFANGAIASIAMSFDVVPFPLPRIVIYGTEGTIEVPDPNTFGGEVRLRRAADQEFAAMPATHSVDRGRGTGVADLAYSILRRERPVRASGALASHVLEVMAAFDRASATETYVSLASAPERPAALPTGLGPNALDA